jgi:hypothetical protein
MNAANNSSSSGKLVPVVVIILGLVGLYYLYQYLFGPRGTTPYTLLDKTRAANTDPSQPIVITSDKLPSIYEGGEFTVSAWIYITNWSYRSGMNKSILTLGGPNFDTIRVYLGGTKPSLNVRLQTREASGANNTVPTGAPAAAAPTTSSTMPVESLDKGTQNAVFNVLQTDSGLLDSSPLCDLPDIDMQRWVNVTIAVNGRTVDVYMDGKLARSCVLPSFYKVDAGGYSAYLLSYGGFGGEISNVRMYDGALNPEQVYKNYMAGPEPITSFTNWFKSAFGPGVSVDIKTK